MLRLVTNQGVPVADLPQGVGNGPAVQAKRTCRRRCEGCPHGGPKVGASGNIDAPLLFMGESPGQREVATGIPFSGPSGELLWGRFPDGYRAKCYVLNAMECFPGGREKKDMGKLVKAVKCCRDHILAKVEYRKRKLIVALGNAALWSLTGNFELKITQERGRLIPSALAEYGILPVVHPAGVMSGSGSFRQFEQDLLYAYELVERVRVSVRSPIMPEIKVHDTPEKVRKLAYDLGKRPLVAADTETTGLNPYSDDILDVGLCCDPHRTDIVPGHLVSELKPLLESRKTRFVWHNGLFDVQFYWRVGINARTDEDSLLLSYCLDENGGVHDLETVAGDLINAPDYKYLVKPYLPNKNTSWAVIPKEVLYKYRLGPDASFTLQCFDILRKRVQSDSNLDKLYTKTLIPYSELISRISLNGIKVDVEQVHRNGRKYVGDFEGFLKDREIDFTREDGLVQQALRKFHQIAGYEVNPWSPQQVAWLLYDKLGFRQIHGRSTDKKVLKLFGNHPVIEGLANCRGYRKFFSTYVVNALDCMDDDGRVRGNFKLHGTPTGRLSCKDYALQTVPRLPDIRSMLCADEGKILIELDLNQAELRSLADLSGDEYLCDLYNSTGRSLHNEMSEFLFPGWDERIKSKDDAIKWIAAEEKMRAKAVNFGIPYGREAPSIAEEFKVTVPEAQSWIDGWFRRAPGAHEFIMKCRRAARNGKTITTTFGNKKRHPIVTRDNVKDLMNQASNFPHQCIASHINGHIGMSIELEPEYYPNSVATKGEKLLKELGAKIVNLVHDCNLIEVPDVKEIREEVKRIAKAEAPLVAKRWGLRRVPFISEAKVGTHWGRLIEEK